MTDSAVMGATGTIKTLADGTFRVQIDIEPRFAQSAFSLFGSPGTPVALARITNEAAVEHGRQQQEPAKQKGGPLAKLAGMWCDDPEFWQWVEVFRGVPIPHGKEVLESAAYVRSVCGVDSRSELDHSQPAAEAFQEFVRGPFMRWKEKRRGA